MVAVALVTEIGLLVWLMPNSRWPANRLVVLDHNPYCPLLSVMLPV